MLYFRTFFPLFALLLLPLTVGAQSVDGLTVDSTGRVGIGTASPDYQLDLRVGVNEAFSIGVGGDNGRIWTEYTAYGPTLIFYDYDDRGVIRFRESPESNNGDNPEYEATIVGYRGNIGIGLRKPSSELEVDGTVSATSVQETSARRFKTEVQPVVNATTLVERLRGVRYQWKESGEPDLGFVAEEVEKVLPALVSHTDSGEAKGLNYSHLTAVLVEALKEQSQRATQLEERLREQQGRLDRQEQETATMKQQIETLQNRLCAKKDSLAQ